jgi:hypothetical protein
MFLNVEMLDNDLCCLKFSFVALTIAKGEGDRFISSAIACAATVAESSPPDSNTITLGFTMICLSTI